MSLRKIAPALALLVLALLAPATAHGQGAPTTPLPAELPATPDEYAVAARKALAIADTAAEVSAARRERGELTASIEAEPVRRWEVSYFAGGEKVLLVVVDGVEGVVEEAWTGDAVAWPMARGRDGQFGHVLNAPWVWIPLCLLFLAGLVEWRRPRRIVHLDLLVLLSFGVSHAFFNAAEVGVSVPLAYPPLLYLLARMLWLGFRGGSALRPSSPTTVLVALCVVLAVFRVTINVIDSGVIDVGYAGVIGADRITDAEPIYGEDAFPEDNPTGDTYGPANYFAYVPFEQAFPWSGAWDDLPAARGAAIAFDLACIAGLIVLGLRLGGRRLAAVLAFAWLAYPYTAFVLQSNSNDSLLAALLIWGLVGFGRPFVRGVLLGAAAMTKFAPLVLAPLYLAGRSAPRRGALRAAGLVAAGLALACALFMLHPLVDPGPAVFWERTLGSQAGRSSPFSIWGQTDLEALHTLAKLAVAALAVALAFVPRERSLPRLAAFAAALMIAVELLAEHWFYLYIVWFLPPLLVALALGDRSGPRRNEQLLDRERAAV